LKEWTTPDCRNTSSTTNLEKEETVDAPGNDGNGSMPEQFKRPNPWRKMMMMIFSLYLQETNHMSKMKPERLMPFKKTEAIYF